MAVIKEKENSLVTEYDNARVKLRGLLLKPRLIIGAGLLSGIIAMMIQIIIGNQDLYLLIIIPLVIFLYGIYQYYEVLRKNGHLVHKSSDIMLSGIEGELRTFDYPNLWKSICFCEKYGRYKLSPLFSVPRFAAAATPENRFLLEDVLGIISIHMSY
ncbi:hypothetical protein [Paenibacillus sp. V4I5]|uniref:hypothetical protein n=1 Tax=Paenibacillus sp. V4I5 TaxID=3042306 RepID=UPI00278DBD0E|nr:hypothetical protein [Paenibacillus sp. V4I5]MDQ0914701.1 hypothetical protein [Paenibacillus sp. V4I5]